MNDYVEVLKKLHWFPMGHEPTLIHHFFATPPTATLVQCFGKGYFRIYVFTNPTFLIPLLFTPNTNSWHIIGLANGYGHLYPNSGIFLQLILSTDALASRMSQSQGMLTAYNLLPLPPSIAISTNVFAPRVPIDNPEFEAFVNTFDTANFSNLSFAEKEDKLIATLAPQGIVRDVTSFLSNPDKLAGLYIAATKERNDEVRKYIFLGDTTPQMYSDQLYEALLKVSTVIKQPLRTFTFKMISGTNSLNYLNATPLTQRIIWELKCVFNSRSASYDEDHILRLPWPVNDLFSPRLIEIFAELIVKSSANVPALELLRKYRNDLLLRMPTDSTYFNEDFRSTMFYVANEKKR